MKKPGAGFFTVLLLLIVIASLAPADADTTQRTVNNGQMILQDVPEIPAALVRRLNQYQNTRYASFLDWAEQGKGMFVRTRFGDVSQIHKLHGPGGAREQLTWFKEPVGQVERRNGGRELAFTMDQGGGEFDQIFLFDPLTAATTMLSDGRSRNRFIRWSRDGQLLAYQSTRRNGRNSDIWIMDPDHPDQTELLVKSEDGEWWAPVDFSKDGRYLLVQQYLNVIDSRIHLLDLKSREMRLLAGDPVNRSANRASSFDTQGKGFYFISNERGRAAELTWRSIEPGGETAFITQDIPWDVSRFELSDDGKRGAFATNEGGISRLYLLNTAKHSFSLIRNMPLGLIYHMKFHPDNRQLALTLNTAQTPSDVFVLNLGRRALDAKSLTRWTYSEVGGLDTRSFIEPELVHFPTFDLNGEKPRNVPAFVYRPRSDGPHPIIIFVHGGPEGQYRPSFNSVLIRVT